MTPAHIAREARTWKGVRFKLQGRNRNGLDCAGLPAVVGEALGILAAPLELPRYRSPLPTGFLLAGLRRCLVERGHERQRAGCGGGAPDCCGDCRDALAGTVVVLGPSRQHCGIVTDTGTLIVVGDVAGCEEVPFSPVLLRLTRNVFEFVGVEYARG